MNARSVVCAVLAALYFLYRTNGLPPLPLPAPVPAPAPVTPPANDLISIARQMSKADREAMGQAYTVLARSVEADPAEDPVFDSTAAVRMAHRAALLCVWKGVLSNPTDKYPGLREQIESSIDRKIGSADVPINPQIRADTVQAFREISAAFSQ